MTGVHIYDPSNGREYRHTGGTDYLSRFGIGGTHVGDYVPGFEPDDVPSHDDTVLAIIDQLTGERVHTLPSRALRIGGLTLGEAPPVARYRR
jgi:hypothetical protein